MWFSNLYYISELPPLPNSLQKLFLDTLNYLKKLPSLPGSLQILELGVRILECCETKGIWQLAFCS